MTSRSHWDSTELKISKLFVVCSHFSFTLKNGDSDFSLVICSSGESLRFFGWDSGVSVDKSSEYTSHCLYTEGKRCNIKQKYIFDITCQHSSLNCSSNSNSLIWVNSLIWGFSEEIFDTFFNLWHSGLSSDQKNFIDLVLGKT